MPRIAREKVIIIDPPPEQATRMNPALGTVERLLNRSMLETQSLRVVHDLIIRDNESRAIRSGPQKLLAAAGLRNGHATLPFADDEEDEQPRRKYKTRKTGKGSYKDGNARKQEIFATKAICGPRLMLFMLESLDDHDYRANTWMMNELYKTGIAGHIKRLSGVWGQLTLPGYLQHDPAKGYRRTKQGREHAMKLREELEREGACVRGGYVAPPGYSTRRGYARTFQDKQASS